MPLVGYWPLHEDSGSTAYDVRGSNNGTISNGGDSTVVGASGLLGNSAYSFDGTNDYIEVPSNGWSGDGVSVTAWVYPRRYGNNGGSYNGIFLRFRLADPVVLNTRQSGDLDAYLYDRSAANTYRVNTPGNTNQWYHMVCTYDGSTLKLYINGELVDSNAINVTPDFSNPSPSTFFGNLDTSTDRYFDGKMQDVRIYDHALAPSTVQYLYEVVANQSNLVTAKKRL
ncbi:MAG: LamG domain-containing protein [Candidatus Nanohaloarchaea archaeon]